MSFKHLFGRSVSSTWRHTRTSSKWRNGDVALGWPLPPGVSDKHPGQALEHRSAPALYSSPSPVMPVQGAWRRGANHQEKGRDPSLVCAFQAVGLEPRWGSVGKGTREEATSILKIGAYNYKMIFIY